jgi:hypothetical protein
MKFWLKLTARIALYLLIPAAYVVFSHKYSPLTNEFIQEMPKPTKLLRASEKYDPKTFGASVRVGFAKRDITPGGFPWLAGYHPPHPALLVNDRLWVKSLAIQGANGQFAVIVTCDLIGLLPDEITKIKELVKGVIHSSRVFIACTHTHSGPDTMGIWGLVPLVTDGKSKKYMRFLRENIAAAIIESISNLQNSKIRFGEGELKGFVRGRYENPNDESVMVIQALVGNKLPVTLVNFACHADDFKNLHISADFPYYLYERLQQLTGGEAMFVQGAIGGVQPTDGELKFYHAKVMGENLADEVVFRILKNPVAPSFVAVRVDQLEVKAALENENFAFGAKTGVLPELRDENNLVAAELNRITIGPAEILTVPGELFPKIWWRVKPLMKGRLKFIFGLTNGEYGYILTSEDYRSGRHNYHVSVSVGSEFGTKIEEAMKYLITLP